MNHITSSNEYAWSRNEPFIDHVKANVIKNSLFVHLYRQIKLEKQERSFFRVFFKTKTKIISETDCCIHKKAKKATKTAKKIRRCWIHADDENSLSLENVSKRTMKKNYKTWVGFMLVLTRSWFAQYC